MPQAKLTYDEAVSATIERWCGTKVRELCAKYDVDPRRLYEVWDGLVHEGALMDAYNRLLKDKPAIAKRIDPSPREPKFKVRRASKNDDEPSLFG